jgi:hypothetical protein
VRRAAVLVRPDGHVAWREVERAQGGPGGGQEGGGSGSGGGSCGGGGVDAGRAARLRGVMAGLGWVATAPTARA